MADRDVQSERDVMREIEEIIGWRPERRASAPDPPEPSPPPPEEVAQEVTPERRH